MNYYIGSGFGDARMNEIFSPEGHTFGGKPVYINASGNYYIVPSADDNFWRTSDVKIDGVVQWDVNPYDGPPPSVEYYCNNASEPVASPYSNNGGAIPNGNVIFYSLPLAISGVVSLSGVLVEGATVRCIRQSDNVALAEATTDVDGAYSFSGLDDAELYHLAVEYETGGVKYNALSLWDVVPVEVV